MTDIANSDGLTYRSNVNTELGKRVEKTVDGKLPVIDGSNVTNVNAATVDGYSIWIGTQAAYDAIDTKDSSTVYYING